jgi:BirA family biotin operon repressor/biotin-[acetyl-CoA-carboxylase] ligase
MSTLVKPAAIWKVPSHRLGRTTLVFDQLDSTNSYAALHVGDQANDGLVILAREQTAGRGQHGRTWTAPAGSSVLLSVLLYPPPQLRRPTVLTSWAAVSVCETISQLTGLSASIKWPNDVLMEGRKVCGILIEQGRGTIAGVGLNLNQADAHFQVAGLKNACSLAMLTQRQFDCDAAARMLIERLDEVYDRLCRGETHSLERRWAEHLNLLGRSAVAECNDSERHGRVTAIGWDAVRMETPAGVVDLFPEMIRHLHPA